MMSLVGLFATAQTPGSAPGLIVSARAVNTRAVVCRDFDDVGRLKFDLTVEYVHGGRTPVFIYKMLSQGAPSASIATSLENARGKKFLVQQSGSVYLGDDDLVKVNQDSFLRLAPGQTHRLHVSAMLFVALAPRPDQIRSGTYWFTTMIRTWPYTLQRPETLNLGGEIWVKDIELEPAEFTITVPPVMEDCEPSPPQ